MKLLMDSFAESTGRRGFPPPIEVQLQQDEQALLHLGSVSNPLCNQFTAPFEIVYRSLDRVALLDGKLCALGLGSFKLKTQTCVDNPLAKRQLVRTQLRCKLLDERRRLRYLAQFNLVEVLLLPNQVLNDRSSDGWLVATEKIAVVSIRRAQKLQYPTATKETASFRNHQWCQTENSVSPGDGQNVELLSLQTENPPPGPQPIERQKDVVGVCLSDQFGPPLAKGIKSFRGCDFADFQIFRLSHGCGRYHCSLPEAPVHLLMK